MLMLIHKQTVLKAFFVLHSTYDCNITNEWNERFQWEKTSVNYKKKLTEMDYCHGNMHAQFRRMPLPMARILLSQQLTGLAHETSQMMLMYQTEQS